MGYVPCGQRQREFLDDRRHACSARSADSCFLTACIILLCVVSFFAGAVAGSASVAWTAAAEADE